MVDCIKLFLKVRQKYRKFWLSKTFKVWKFERWTQRSNSKITSFPRSRKKKASSGSAIICCTSAHNGLDGKSQMKCQFSSIRKWTWLGVSHFYSWSNHSKTSSFCLSPVGVFRFNFAFSFSQLGFLRRLRRFC